MVVSNSHFFFLPPEKLIQLDEHTDRHDPGHGQVASPSASSRSASPKRREKQPEQSQSTGDLPKRGGASPEGYSPRKEGRGCEICESR